MIRRMILAAGLVVPCHAGPRRHRRDQGQSGRGRGLDRLGNRSRPNWADQGDRRTIAGGCLTGLDVAIGSMGDMTELRSGQYRIDLSREPRWESRVNGEPLGHLSP